jgi:hypothetical protein
MDKVRREIWNVSFVLGGLIILGAMTLSLYLLVDHHAHPADAEVHALNRRLDEVNRHIEQLERPLQPPSKQTANEAFQQDLKQHELLLNELRTERSQVEDQIKSASEVLKEVKETEDRTRSAAALFLGIFGAVATILLGQNYWQFRGWKEKADQSLEDINAVKPDIDLIRGTRATLENRLPKYIEEVRNDLVEFKFPAGPALAKMHEIDHLAYLSNTEMRFKESLTSKEANRYLMALLVSARGHALQHNYYGADDRLEEFFRQVVRYPDAVSGRERARGYSIRAFIFHRLMLQIASAPSWIRDLRLKEAEGLRSRAFAEVKKSQECDQNWWHSYFVEALLYSLQYVPDQLSDPQKTMFLDGQRKAIAIYQHLTKVGSGFNQGMGAWQNLACCLKRVADITGQQNDYDIFKAELGKFPSDRQIRQGFIENGRPESEEVFLWQAMLQDDVLFGKVDKIDLDGYRLFWNQLLTEKVRLRDWKNDLQEMKKRADLKMAGWIL